MSPEKSARVFGHFAEMLVNWNEPKPTDGEGVRVSRDSGQKRGRVKAAGRAEDSRFRRFQVISKRNVLRREECLVDAVPTRMATCVRHGRSVKSVGYQILIVWCEACGHVDAKRAMPGKRFRCP